MGLRTKIEIGTAVVLAAVLLFCSVQHKKIQTLSEECSRYKTNNQVLLSDIWVYKTRDSLSAAKVEALQLTVKEFQKFRAEDAELIKTLQKKNRDLTAVNKTQYETIIALSSVPKDTTLITKDSLITPATTIHCGDEWYDFDGILTKDLFTGTLHNRDALIIAETVKYKRFLGFLWKTKEIKDRRVDVVSKNPHTEITGVEHVIIVK